MRLVWLLTILGSLALGAFADTLSSQEFSNLKKSITKALGQGQVATAEAEISQLAADNSYRAAEFLAEIAVKVQDGRIQDACVRGIAKMDGDDVASAFADAFAKGKGEWKSRVLFCDALAGMKSQASLSALIAALKDKHETVRKAALMAARQRKDPTLVDGVIELLAAEEAKGGILASMSRDFLRSYTGEKLEQASDWKNWWASSRDSFDPRAVQERPATGRAEETVLRNPQFFGTEISSKRVVFILDISGSMQEIDASTTGGEGAGRVATGGDSAEKQALERFGIPDKAATRMRVDRAKHELKRVIALLNSDVQFTILAYHGLVKQGPNNGIAKESPEKWLFIWKPALSAASDKSKKSAIEFIDGLQAYGATFTLAALNTAFEAKDADTIYLLSDGMPTEPTDDGREVTTSDILAHIKGINRLRKNVIHTFGFEGGPSRFGPGAGADFAQFLKDLAEQNGGTYRAIE